MILLKKPQSTLRNCQTGVCRYCMVNTKNTFIIILHKKLCLFSKFLLVYKTKTLHSQHNTVLEKKLNIHYVKEMPIYLKPYEMF